MTFCGLCIYLQQWGWGTTSVGSTTKWQWFCWRFFPSFKIKKSFVLKKNFRYLKIWAWAYYYNNYFRIILNFSSFFPQIEFQCVLLFTEGEKKKKSCCRNKTIIFVVFQFSKLYLRPWIPVSCKLFSNLFFF